MMGDVPTMRSSTARSPGHTKVSPLYHLPGKTRGGLLRQPDRGRDDRLGLRHGNVRRTRPIATAVHPGVDPPWTEHIDGDVSGPDFFGQAQEHALHGSLAHRVAHPPWAVSTSRPGTDTKDRTRALREHARQGEFAQQERSAHVDCQTAVEE